MTGESNKPNTQTLKKAILDHQSNKLLFLPLSLFTPLFIYPSLFVSQFGTSSVDNESKIAMEDGIGLG